MKRYRYRFFGSNQDFKNTYVHRGNFTVSLQIPKTQEEWLNVSKGFETTYMELPTLYRGN
jgi:hypothetical protein